MTTRPSSPPEARFLGIPAAPGIAVGIAHVMGDARDVAVLRTIEEDEITGELSRFAEAKVCAKLELARVSSLSQDAADSAAMLEAYVAMLDDPELAGRVTHAIKVDLSNAESAICLATDAIAALFLNAKDAYIQERRHDVVFVGDLLLRALARPTALVEALFQEGRKTIILARDLSPADTAGVVRATAVAFSTERGSRTSHTAIMARALEIPAVLGATGLLRHATTGDLVVVDGFRGEVILHPTVATLAAAEARMKSHRAFVESLRAAGGDEPVATADGTRIELFANVELAEEARVARAHGAEGIGLFRTEFLYIDRSTPPTEDEQFEIYRGAVEAMHGGPVVLRTFDIGGDKFVSAFQVPEEMNPALGLRAVRLALSRPDVLLTQLRAMARASAFGDVRILVPLVSQVSELSRVRALLTEAVSEVRRRGLATANHIPLGMMIEVPSAAIMADVFARYADFFALGTNDLVQYLLAVDRTNTALAPLASPYDPAVLRLLGQVADVAETSGTPLSICGAMASDLHALPLLLGLGLRKFSMEPSALRTVRAALQRLDLAVCKPLADRARKAESADEVRTLARQATEPLLSDLLALCAAT